MLRLIVTKRIHQGLQTPFCIATSAPPFLLCPPYNYKEKPFGRKAAAAKLELLQDQKFFTKSLQGVSFSFMWLLFNESERRR
jgi:hypothetical protein